MANVSKLIHFLCCFSHLYTDTQVHSSAIKFKCTNNFVINYLLKLCLLCNCCVPKDIIWQEKTKCSIWLIDVDRLIFFCFLFSANMKNGSRDIPNVSAWRFYSISQKKHLFFSRLWMWRKKNFYYLKHNIFLSAIKCRIEDWCIFWKTPGDLLSVINEGSTISAWSWVVRELKLSPETNSTENVNSLEIDRLVFNQEPQMISEQ